MPFGAGLSFYLYRVVIVIDKFMRPIIGFIRPLFFFALCFGAKFELSAADSDFDPYGGWTGKQFEATGYFHLEQGEDRWWLVTPEGNAFLINGQDHVSPGAINRSYNRDHWNKKLGLTSESSAEERITTFYQKKVVKDAEYLGFNTLYSHSVPLGMNVIPYIPRAQTIFHEYWRTHSLVQHRPKWSEDNFVDVYSDSFVESVKATGQKMVDQKRDKDPWILAWGLTDVPILVPYEARPFPPGFYHKPLPGTTTWPVRLRNLGADAPGKQAYVALMRQRYKNRIEDFNTTYNTAFDSWDALAEAEDWRNVIDINGNIREERDNHAFLMDILDKAWGTQARVLKEYLPNHMIWGDTLNLNSPLPDELIQVYAKHFPVIVYQFYGATWEDHRLVMDRLRKLTGKPVFSADSSWAVPQPPHMPDPLGPQCANYSVAADRFEEVFYAAFKRSDFIGWGWCGMMDNWASSEPVKQHGGMQDVFGKWHQPLADRRAKFGKELYEVAVP